MAARFNPSIQRAEAGGSPGLWAQSALHSEFQACKGLVAENVSFFFFKNKTSRHGKDMKKLEPSCNAGKHIEQCVRRGKMSGSLSASRTESHLGRHTRGNMFLYRRIYTNIYTSVTHSNPEVKTTRSDEWIHRMNINTVSKILIIKRMERGCDSPDHL